MTGGERETIRIEAATRRDALDLMQRLLEFRTHLVQLSDHRWIVCIRQDRDLDELTAGVLDAATRWVSDRDVESTVSLGGRSYALHP